MIKDNVVFIRQCFSDFQNTGALCRSSQKAAEGLTEPLRTPDRAPLNILELGPGTGAVTIKILEYMKPGDRFDTCEINPEFMAALKKRLAGEPSFQRHEERVNFLLCPAQQLPLDRKYDLIIGCLPFLNFEIATVKAIFERLKMVSHQSTIMTYFEYTGLRTTGIYVSRRLRLINDYLVDIYNHHRISRKRVLLNLFPMNIHYLKIGENYKANTVTSPQNHAQMCSNY